MGFILVSSLEKKRLIFVVVPEKWVDLDKGILFWPKHLLRCQTEKLRADSDSVPETNWVPQECSIKVKNIKTFENGLELEKSFVEFTDTEAEETFLRERAETEIRKKINTSSVLPVSQGNYENLFNVATTSTTDVDLLPPIIIEEINQTSENFVDATQPFGQKSINEINTEEAGIDVPQLIGDIVEQAMKKRYQEIEDKFEKGFREMDLRLSQNSVKLDKILNILSESSGIVMSDAAQKTTEEKTVIEFDFPISDPDKVVELELKLSRDTQFKNVLMKELCKFGGTTRNEQADKVIYPIFYFLFRPELLTNFTWTGASRSHEIHKRSFQKFESIIDLVYNVLTLADSRLTKTKNESLIRDKVLKHTNQRLIRKRKHQKNMDKGEKCNKSNLDSGIENNVAASSSNPLIDENNKTTENTINKIDDSLQNNVLNNTDVVEDDK